MDVRPSHLMHPVAQSQTAVCVSSAEWSFKRGIFELVSLLCLEWIWSCILGLPNAWYLRLQHCWCLRMDGLMCGFLAALHTAVQSQAAHLSRIPCCQNKASAMTLWTFKSKIIRLSKIIPELLALVMTLAPVVLEHWVWAGMSTEKPLWMKSVNTVLHRWLHPSPHPPCFLEAGLLPFLLVGKGRYVISFKVLC